MQISFWDKEKLNADWQQAGSEQEVKFGEAQHPLIMPNKYWEVAPKCVNN